ALMGRTTALPLATGAAGFVVGATVASKGGEVGNLVTRGCQTAAAKATAAVGAPGGGATGVGAGGRPPLVPLPLGGRKTGGGGPHASRPAGVITEFPLPTANSGAGYLTSGPDGNLWFTEAGGLPSHTDRIGRITPSGVITEFPLPIANS